MVAWIILSLTIVGCLLCAGFIIEHRPSRPLSWTSLNAMGWEVIVFLVLLRSAIELVLRGTSSYSDSWYATAHNLFGLISLALIDIMVIYRLITFVHFRSAYDTESQRLRDHEHDHDAR